MEEKKHILLSIAGFDPSGGAGILLDIKVFTHFGFRGMGLVTALTAQNSRTVGRLHHPPAEFLEQQARILEEGEQPAGIKLGMVGKAANLPVIKEILQRHPDRPVVIDPVFRSTSGTWLFEKKGISGFIDAFKGKPSLVTPNLDEVYLLTGFRAEKIRDLEKAGEAIHHLFRAPCLIKGGHLGGEIGDAFFDGRRLAVYPHVKKEKNVHGTGCLLSSCILSLLVHGITLEQACAQAVEWTQSAIDLAAIATGGRQVFITLPPFSPPLPSGPAVAEGEPDR